MIGRVDALSASCLKTRIILDVLATKRGNGFP